MKSVLKRIFAITGPFFLGGYAAAQLLPQIYPAGMPVNSVRQLVLAAPEADAAALVNRPVRDVRMATQYLDGLGRPVQTVIKQGSLETGQPATDMVAPVYYDELGRETYKYLPFASNNIYGNGSTNTGLFKRNPFQQQQAFMQQQYGAQGETYFYGKTNYEASPLNRIEKSMAPGNSWAGSNRGVENKYWLNTVTDNVKTWKITNSGVAGVFGSYALETENNSGVYETGQLYKFIIVDEHGNQVIEFRDKENKTVLKKIQVETTPAIADDGTGRGYDGWICTYYLYDNKNNLRCVVQPEGVKALIANNWQFNSNILNEQCFRYEYDERGRMTMKKVPGAGEVYMVYDARDRLVMTQDANLRANNNWLVTKYDDLDRPVETGLLYSATPFGTHLSLANNSIDYPSTVSAYEQLTVSHYDNYNGLPAGLSDYITAWDGYFSATDNGNWPYPQMPVKSAATKGMVTWTQTKILGTSSFINTVIYYDVKGRVIQAQSTNIAGGTDVITTQYTWAGQPLLTVQKQEKPGTNAQTIVALTKITYDDLGRLIKTEKAVSNTLINGGAMAAYKTVAEHQYDKLGQLKKKVLAPAYAGGGLENLSYDYNIRGWLLGMNRDYAKDATTSNYFGFDLGYDKPNNNIIGGQTYNKPQYNGNIEGMVWKSKGDGEKRKYDFAYDAANRLLKADFTQYTSGLFNQDAGVNFNMKAGDGITASSAYDNNGNIKQIQQWGLKITGSVPIDNLKYTYESGSNRLKSVTDFNNDAQTLLGDFRTAVTHPQAGTKATLTTASPPGSFDMVTDYSYDANGNLKLDNNKAISNIVYNHLNLPAVITVAGKGTISYTYDAAGNKLKKVVAETGQPVKTTLYDGGAIYENDVLQFINHEEGRIRFKALPSGGFGWVYDYMIKDHLGNIRMVLTEEQQQDKYPVASMEDAKLSTEQQYYTINTGNIVTASSVTGLQAYTNDNGIGNNPADAAFSASNSAKLYKLNSNTAKTGLGITLKVMAGDRIDIFGKSYYFQNNTGGSGANSNVAVLELLSGLLGTPGGAAAGGHTTATELNGVTGVVNPLGNTYLTNPLRNNTGFPQRPRAFINYVFLDEQFKLVPDNYGFSAVNNTPGLKDHYSELQNRIAQKNGYVYIYVSNESPVNVFFDNLQVVHTRGAILEETHYYPFGLTMNGISSRTLSYYKTANNYKYNGIEWNNEFVLNMYDAFYRNLDPQIGRFWQVDPKPLLWESHYASMGNNPILNIDPLGDTTINGQKYEPQTPEYATTLENVTLSSTPRLKGVTILTFTSCHIPKSNVELEQERWWYNETKNLDHAHGQVMPPRPKLIDFVLGEREIEDPDYSPDDPDNIYTIGGFTYTKTGTLLVNSDGYIVGANATSNLKTGMPPNVGFVRRVPIPSFAQRAEALSKELGRNSITIKTINGHIRYDLVGRSHGHVPTPHSLTYTRNVGPNGMINFSQPKFPTPMTQQDLRIIRNYLKSLK